MSYNVLSIDGGGLRGLIALTILEKLDQAAPGWRNHINMFAGTSTGALIALALAKGMAPRDIMDVYIGRAQFIFDRGLWQEVKSVGDIVGAKYPGTNRETVCRQILLDQRLGDYIIADPTKGHVVVCAFDLDNPFAANPSDRRWSAKIFHNLPVATGTNDADEYSYRVAMRTSAAPTYFPSYDGFVDGGVYATNPSMCALAQTQDSRLATPIPLATVKMLSLGTGYAPNFVAGEENWGVAEWGTRLVDLLMDGVNEVADFQVKQLISDRYVRLSPALGTSVAMDDPSLVGQLQVIGNSVDVTSALPLVSAW